jgi:hypothetical protein
MSEPSVKPISAEDRKRWQQHNIETLREWRAIPFTRKIQMVEELEEVARSIHGGNLPEAPSERQNGPKKAIVNRNASPKTR